MAEPEGGVWAFAEGEESAEDLEAGELAEWLGMLLESQLEPGPRSAGCDAYGLHALLPPSIAATIQHDACECWRAMLRCGEGDAQQACDICLKFLMRGYKPAEGGPFSVASFYARAKAHSSGMDFTAIVHAVLSQQAGAAALFRAQLELCVISAALDTAVTLFHYGRDWTRLTLMAAVLVGSVGG